MMGNHAFFASVNKCLSVEKGKEKNVGEASFCCAGYVSVGGRIHLLKYLESLQVEISNCIGKLKLCYCCLQFGRWEGDGPRLKEATKEAHVTVMERDKGLEENKWTVKEKKAEEEQGKGFVTTAHELLGSGQEWFWPDWIQEGVGPDIARRGLI